jgi:hypothetical protein
MTAPVPSDLKATPERKQAEEQLRESEFRIHAFWDNNRSEKWRQQPCSRAQELEPLRSGHFSARLPFVPHGKKPCPDKDHLCSDFNS